MGRKSREKRERKQRQEQGTEIVQEGETGLSRFFLFIIRYGVYLALFAPLIVSGRFYFPFVGPKSLYFMGLAQIVIFSWLGLIIVSRKYRPKFSPLAFALFLFFAILILSALFGVSPANSFWSMFERMTGILMWCHLIGFFLVIVSVFRKKSDWQKILAVSLFVAVVVSMLSLFGRGGSTRGGATIGNTSFMGTYLLLNVFWAVYLFFKTKKWWRIYPALCFLIITVALYFSTARAALLCFYGGLFLLALFYLAFKPRMQWLRTLGKVLLIGCFLIAIAAVFSMFHPHSPVREKFVEKATRSRLVVWQEAWEGFKERPLLGWGPENFELVFTKHYNPCMSLPECGGEIWFDRSHNIIFDTLVTSGILGLLAYLAVFVTALYLSLKKYLKGKIGFWAFAVPSAILISYFIQNLTVFDMISSYLMFFMVLGFMASRQNGSEPQKNARAWRSQARAKLWIFGLLFVAFCFSFFYFVIQPARTDAFVIDALKANGSAKRTEFYQKALAASPLGKFQIREFFGQRTRNLFQKDTRRIPKDVASRELDLVINMLKKTMREYPLDFRSALQLSQIYSLYAFIDKEKAKDAEISAQEAINLSPTNQQGYWALAQAKVYQGDIQAALSAAEKAIELEPRVFQSHEIALKIAKISGNKDLINTVVQKALEVNPDWRDKLHPLDN